MCLKLNFETVSALQSDKRHLWKPQTDLEGSFQSLK